MENARRLTLEEIEQKLEKQNYGDDEIQRVMPKLEEIFRLREEKKAIILAHYYQTPPIQLISDFRGDSLQLAMAARNMNCEGLVVSSTVHFMAEMIKILSPEKKVVIPDLEAGCSIANGINGATIRRIGEAHPDAAIIGYINTGAEARAEMDVVCTSANAERVASRVPERTVIMLPDYFFSKNILKRVNNDNPEKHYLAYVGIENGKIRLEDVSGKNYYPGIPIDQKDMPQGMKGTCIVHEQFIPEQIREYRTKYNVSKVLAHPEVRPDVAAEADMVGGTQKMLEYVGSINDKRFMILTECDLIAPLKEQYPDREFVTPCLMCPHMKKNSLDNVIASLRDEKYEINVDAKVAEGAKRSIDRMFEITN
ncbi:MAG: quinolinate synthase [archaeon]